LIDVKGVQALASLPSREVLLAKIIGSLVAPHRGILGVMHGVPRALVSVINQIKEQKVEAESA
jgi:large subunit ribosomal protein L10